jgi:CRP/FNR family transcriptional regulator/CRP/FNR family cyclic AMP-dependent transcriptional regulator
MIRSVSLFKGLRERELKSIAKRCVERSFQPGETIVKEGKTGVGFYLIADGSVEVQRKGKTISGLKKGDFFGEMTLIDDQPRSADVVAITPTTCYVLVAWAFLGLVRSDPDIGVSLMKELVRRLRGTNMSLTE